MTGPRTPRRTWIDRIPPAPRYSDQTTGGRTPNASGCRVVDAVSRPPPALSDQAPPPAVSTRLPTRPCGHLRRHFGASSQRWILLLVLHGRHSRLAVFRAYSSRYQAAAVASQRTRSPVFTANVLPFFQPFTTGLKLRAVTAPA